MTDQEVDNKINQLRELIVPAIKNAKDKGFKPQPRVTLDFGKMECCPLGALAYLNLKGHLSEHDAIAKAERFLINNTDLVPDEIYAFIYGFDFGKQFVDKYLNAGDELTEFIKLGESFHEGVYSHSKEAIVEFIRDYYMSGPERNDVLTLVERDYV